MSFVGGRHSLNAANKKRQQDIRRAKNRRDCIDTDKETIMTPELALVAYLVLAIGEPIYVVPVARVAIETAEACALESEAFNAQSAEQRFMSGAPSYVIETGREVTGDEAIIDFDAYCITQ